MPTSEQCQTIIADSTNNTARFLGINLDVQPEEINNRTEFIGKCYGIATKECIEAILVAARSDTLLLDPVYTGKAFAGILADTNDGSLQKRYGHLYPHRRSSSLIQQCLYSQLDQ